MASVNLSGTLTNPEGEPDEGAIVKFTLLTTTGNTVSSSKSQLEVPQDGLYDIDIVYGNLRVDYINEDGSTRFVAIVTVNGDTVATSLPELLNAVVPPTNAQLLQFQAILADAVTAKTGAELAETGAVAAEAGAVAAAADIVNIRRETVHNISILTDAVANTDIAVGDAINLAERTAGNGGGAMWDVVLASGVTANTFNIVACTGVSSLALVLRKEGIFDLKELSDATDKGQALTDALTVTRSVKLGNSQTETFDFQTPVKLQSFTNIIGEGVAGIFGTNVFYGGVTKSTNTSTTITNPERPSVTIDTMFYPDGEYEDGNFPQTFNFRDLTAKCAAPSKVGTNFYFILQGSSTTMKNVNILDFQFAINSYETWSSYFEKVKTNGKMSFNRGTSIVLNQCSSGGQSSDGTIYGGFEFNEIRYSQLLSCSSDNTPGTAYTFTNCFQFALNACGSEFTRGDDDNTGDCIAFALGNQMSINNYYGVVIDHPTRAAFSVSNDKVIFNQGKMVNITGHGGTATFNNFDLVVTGNGGYVEFNQFQFSNGTYDTPKIRFNSGVTNTIVVVHGQTSDRLPKIYYSDGTGATLLRTGIIEAGLTATGYFAKFDDGTLMCWHTLPKTDFLSPSSTSNAAQGIDFFRSNVKNWLYPKPFINSTSAHVTITPRMGTGGTRLAWSRYSDTGETNAQTGQIQLVGVEDWIAAGQAYVDLIDVQVTATGKWK